MSPEININIEPDAEETIEETDELIERLDSLETISNTRHGELLERLESCRSNLERLSTESTAENPRLSELAATLGEIRAELSSLKSSMDTISSHPLLSASQEPIATVEALTVLDEPALENQTVEVSAGNEEPTLEAPPPSPPARKNRFV